LSSVFISYAREDHAEAQSVAEALNARAVSVFWDRTIPTGRSFEAVIEEAMASAKAVVVLWSRHSVQSEWVRAEAAEGARRGILVPAALDGESPPLRYRITQTADLTDWRPGLQTPSFTAFIADVAATVNRGDSMGGQGEVQASSRGRPPASALERDIVVPHASIRRYVDASLVFAWLGSLSLAATAAHDYGVVTSGGVSWTVAYWLTLVSLLIGGTLSILLGAVSLKSHFVLGTLQGWLWPVLAALGELTILMSASTMVRALPYADDLESLLLFLLFGTIGPALLTVGGVFTKRALGSK
jgi:hypothetical protein